MAEKPTASDSTTKPDASAEPSLKEQGNALFRAGNYLKAAALYTQAIKEDPENHALYRLVKLSRSLSLMCLLCCSLQPAASNLVSVRLQQSVSRISTFVEANQGTGGCGDDHQVESDVGKGVAACFQNQG